MFIICTKRKKKKKKKKRKKFQLRVALSLFSSSLLILYNSLHSLLYLISEENRREEREAFSFFFSTNLK